MMSFLLFSYTGDSSLTVVTDFSLTLPSGSSPVAGDFAAFFLSAFGFFFASPLPVGLSPYNSGSSSSGGFLLLDLDRFLLQHLEPLTGDLPLSCSDSALVAFSFL